MINASRPADVAGDRLSPLDAWFLYLERPTELLHVGAIAVLEAPPSFEGLVDTLGQRLAALRRYRQVPVRPTLDLGPPRWRDDPEFDLRRHIKRVMVPASGDDAAFQRVFEELFGRPFASEHPLWECYLLEGLAGGRAALLTKVHHCMIDGVSGMQVLEVMTDGQATTSGAGRLASPADATATPLGRYLTGLTRELFGGLESVLRVVTDPGRAVANLRATVAAAGVVADLTRERLRPFSFNGTLSHTRRIVWATFDLDEFLAIRGAAGCKVNDVALAVIAGALRRFLPVEATARGRRARALIPMSIRRDDEYLTLGNRVSGMFASLPLDVADARERLHLIAAEMHAHKEGGQALAFDCALAVLGAVPTVLAPLIARLPRQWPVAHTVCTNVPGPRQPRFLLGQRVLAVHPVVPLAVDIGLGFAILSYAGTVSITATADATLVPDVDRLPAALTAAAAELACQFGVRAAAVRPRTKRRTALTVSDLMTRDVVTIGPREFLTTAWRTMHTRRIRHLPVVDHDGILRGLVTHRDLLAASPSSLSLQAESDRVRWLGWAEAADVMETHVSTAAPGESAADVGLRMARQKIGCLPVVEAGGAIVGIVTEEDFLRWSAENMAAAEQPGTSAVMTGAAPDSAVPDVVAAHPDRMALRALEGVMEIAKWMKSPVRTVKPLDSIRHARDVMAEHRINQLPVVVDGRVVGIVSDRDLRDAFPSVFADPARRAGPDPDHIRVEAVMTSDVFTLAPSDTMIAAASLMRRERIGAIPIVDGTRLVGILARSDALDALVGLDALVEAGGSSVKP